MVSVQKLPSSAEAYYAGQRRESAAALRAVQRQWDRLSPGAVVASWDALSAGLLAVVLTAQGRITRPTGRYVSDVLRETGQERLDDPFADVTPDSLTGFAGDGRPVKGLLAQAPVKVLDGLGAGLSGLAAKQLGGRFLNLAVATALSDTSRQAEKLHIAARPVSGYVRMLTPPSCSRCAILAGKWSRSATPFQRHPGCDCRTIPAGEAAAGDLTVDVSAYFDSLPAAEQERVFTKAGAAVIREGADPSQVVNARRGMTKSQAGRLTRTEVSGQQVYTTSVNRTRSGVRTAGRGRPYVRLMPESIVELAQDRDDLVRLLRLYGYLL